MKKIIMFFIITAVISYLGYRKSKRDELSFYSITCGKGEDEQSFRSKTKVSDNMYDVPEIGVMNTSGCSVREVKP